MGFARVDHRFIGTSQDKVPIDEVLVEMELAERRRIVWKN